MILKKIYVNSSLKEVKKIAILFFICLPTPMKNDGSCDISLVENTIKEFSEKWLYNNM